VKVSAVKPEHRVVRARPWCLRDQHDFAGAYSAGELQRDFHRRGALPGPTRQRHARAAQTHAAAGQSAGCRLQGGTGHRWPHVRAHRARCQRPSISARRLWPTAPLRVSTTATWMLLDCERGVLRRWRWMPPHWPAANRHRARPEPQQPRHRARVVWPVPPACQRSRTGRVTAV
jgi:phosphogluconate dehydratase